MHDEQDALLEAVLEIRELIKLMAGPAMALRDEKLSKALKQIVGRSSVKEKAVLLMDGSRTQTDIRLAMKIDPSDLSKLVRALRESGLLHLSDKLKIMIPLANDFFKEGKEG